MNNLKHNIHITWKWAMKKKGPIQDCQMTSANGQWDDGDVALLTSMNQM
jgi:hypothetical protein